MPDGAVKSGIVMLVIIFGLPYVHTQQSHAVHSAQ
jgi:hypothetical protein